MSKVDEYTGNGMIVVSDGEVWAVDDSGLPDVIGEIGRVELSIEMPEDCEIWLSTFGAPWI